MPGQPADYTPEEEVQIEADLHAWLSRYIAEDVSLQELRHWLTHRSWRVRSKNMPLWGLYAVTRARILAFDQEDWTEDQLRDSLAVHLAWFRGEPLPGNDPMALPSTDTQELAALAEGTPVTVRTVYAPSTAELDALSEIDPTREHSS